MVEGFAEGGGGGNHRIREEDRHLLTLEILVHLQSSETSSMSSLWLPPAMGRRGWGAHLHIKGLRPEVEVEIEKVWRHKAESPGSQI